MSYLTTFEEYQKLGGKCTQDAFPTLQYDTEIKMDYITYGKLSKLMTTLDTIPLNVQMLEVKLIDILNVTNADRDTSITSYSNGIESFSYASDKDAEDYLIEKFKSVMMQYLYPEYPELFYRGRWVTKRDRNNNLT